MTFVSHDGVQLLPVVGIPSGGGVDLTEQPGQLGHCQAVERFRTGYQCGRAWLHRHRTHSLRRGRATGRKGRRSHRAHGHHWQDGPTGTFQEGDGELRW